MGVRVSGVCPRLVVSRPTAIQGFFIGKMSIIRIQKREHPYVQIDKRCLADSRLSWRARGVLAYLLSKPNDWIVSVKDIENNGLEGRDAVQNALKELQQCGYATLETAQDDLGRLIGKRWIVAEEPINGFSVYGYASDDLKNRPTEKPSNGKSAYTNNELNSNNEFKEEEKDAALSSSTFGAENKNRRAVDLPPAPQRYVRTYSPEDPDISIVEPAPMPEYKRDERAASPVELRRVNIPEEIERLKGDHTVLEAFTMSRKIPYNHFADYIAAFQIDITGRGETYNSPRQFRQHFFNWCGIRWERELKRQQQQKPSGIPHGIRKI